MSEDLYTVDAGVLADPSHEVLELVSHLVVGAPLAAEGDRPQCVAPEPGLDEVLRVIEEVTRVAGVAVGEDDGVAIESRLRVEELVAAPAAVSLGLEREVGVVGPLPLAGIARRESRAVTPRGRRLLRGRRR